MSSVSNILAQIKSNDTKSFPSNNPQSSIEISNDQLSHHFVSNLNSSISMYIFYTHSYPYPFHNHKTRITSHCTISTSRVSMLHMQSTTSVHPISGSVKKECVKETNNTLFEFSKSTMRLTWLVWKNSIPSKKEKQLRFLLPMGTIHCHPPLSFPLKP